MRPETYGALNTILNLPLGVAQPMINYYYYFTLFNRNFLAVRHVEWIIMFNLKLNN